MRVVVTGGAGFIGSHVVDQVTAAGHDAVLFDLLASPHHEQGDVEHVIGDLTDAVVARRALRGADAVIHLAAMADVNEVAADPARADHVNVYGTKVVLEAARDENVPRLIYGSTVWVYDDAPGDGVLDEDAALGSPSHPYTATKLAGEHHTRTHNDLYGSENCVLRFGIPYGPRARAAAVVPSFVARAARGEALTIAGDGRQTRQFVYVEELAAGIVAALRPAAGGRTYNLVRDEEVSVRQIADTVREVVGPVPLVHGPERPADVRLRRVSGERAAVDLGWRPTVSFADGVRRYAAWLGVTNGSPDSATA